MIRSRILIASILACIAGHLPAQIPGTVTDEAPTQASSILISRLKFSRLALDQANEIAAELRTRSTRDRLNASKVLRDHCLRFEKSFDKLSHDVLLDFAKAAKKAQRSLLGRKGEAEIETLRAESLQVSRLSDLSKDQIKQECDPRMAKLRELLMPSLKAVLASDAKLDAELTELRIAHQELRDWHSLYASMAQGLELHEDAAKHFKKYPAPTHPGDPERIDQAIALAMFAGLAMSGTDRKALESNEDLRTRAPHQEYLGTLQLNEIRYLLGLNLLLLDEKLSDAGRDHSFDMHTLKFFSHTSPVAGKEQFGKRAANFGTTAHAENIAAGQQTGHGAIRAWWYSPGHHRNMLSSHRRTGLGNHESMWTQLFGG